ncbi:GNAT family N-acetyltransferase [Streptomyces sp. LX-29]|uniref:GNAT family N-acetyltransferase n=1 Tax=Streptomyces sp. LX-29 TaxID=2900152 RepID=UPI00240DA025|nr:GNAT family N-acetyltransferase [Streptomyces sp. LX-29]WFB06998.1 GNAT family N-acetyltransferase [Streptomyces sp. LX-29]
MTDVRDLNEQVRIAHTWQLDASELAAVRALMDEAFEGDFDDEDWDHGLGGVHALLWRDGVLAAHGAVVQRRLVHGGRALRAGYVEAVAVREELRRQGYGAAVMRALEPVLRGAYEVAALSAADDAAAFYEALGWVRWQGPTSALTPKGVERTEEDDDSTYVLPLSAPLALDGELICDWRDGDVW